MRTIGYGDAYLITDLGRFLSVVISLIGIGLVALPIGIISSGFREEFRTAGEEKYQTEEFTYCPHCGKKIYD